MILAQCPLSPQMRTDYMAIITIALAGTICAAHHSRRLARMWECIGRTNGEDVATLARDGKLVWLLAHKSSSAIGEAKLSMGSGLSSVDWRANRLVDTLGLDKRLHAELGTRHGRNPSQVNR